MGLLDGKVAMITGGGRGQGRSHALTLAREGADILVCDICDEIEDVPYPLATEADLKETVRLVEELGRRVVAVKADVRNHKQVKAVVDRGISEFGKIDILIANAGVTSYHTLVELTEEQFDCVVDTNLKGVFNCINTVVPHMLRQNYGRVVATSSMSGRQGQYSLGHYDASKWGIIGMIKALSLETAKNGITANCILPTSVNTGMLHNATTYRLFLPGLDSNPSLEQVGEVFKTLNPMEIPWVEPEDIANAALFLVTDSARYINGETLAVSAGWSANTMG